MWAQQPQLLASLGCLFVFTGRVSAKNLAVQAASQLTSASYAFLPGTAPVAALSSARLPPHPACLLPRRQDEAGGPQGYSLEEACLLCRSSLPQQRVLALRLLAAVLALNRPSPASPASAPLPLPPAVAAELQLPAGLQRVAVWHHALHAADAALLLRRSLDDQHPAVAAAAAAALAALLGASGPAAAAEEQAAEAADAGPLTGWPAPPLRHMQVGWVGFGGGLA